MAHGEECIHAVLCRLRERVEDDMRYIALNKPGDDDPFVLKAFNDKKLLKDLEEFLEDMKLKELLSESPKKKRKSKKNEESEEDEPGEGEESSEETP